MEGGGQASFNIFASSQRARTFLERNIRKVIKRAELPAHTDSKTMEERPAKRQRLERPQKHLPPTTKSYLLQEVFKAQNPRKKLRETLRIDIRGVVNFLSDNGRSLRDDPFPRSRCRCSVSLFHVVRNTHVELCKLSQLGYLEPGPQDSDTDAFPIVLPGPFLIAADMLHVNIEEGFGLAQNYVIQISLDRVGTLTPWPPLPLSNALDNEPISKRVNTSGLSKSDISLVAKSGKVISPGLSSQNLPLNAKLGSDREPTGHILAVEINWSLPSQSLVAEGPLLSLPIKDDAHVDYGFVFCNSSEPRRIRLRGYTCCLCGQSTDCITSLQFHLVTSHKSYSWSEPQMSEHSAIVFFLYFKKKKVSAFAKEVEISDTIQLGLPAHAFRLEKYLRGETDWITNREGSENGRPSSSNTDSAPLSSSEYSDSRTPQAGSSHFSPNTSEEPHELPLEPLVPQPSKSTEIPATQTKSSPGTSEEPHELLLEPLILQTSKLVRQTTSLSSTSAESCELLPLPLALLSIQPPKPNVISVRQTTSSIRTSEESPEFRLAIPVPDSSELKTISVSQTTPPLRMASKQAINATEIIANISKAQDVNWNLQPSLILKIAAPPQLKTIPIPQTKRPLFDVISKQMLKAGEIISDNSNSQDFSWIDKKHIDIIHDFSDVTDMEKEFIIAWDTFLRETSLNQSNLLPEACVRFVDEHTQWLAEKPSRRVEFAKLLTMLHLRGTIDTRCLGKCSALVGRIKTNTHAAHLRNVKGKERAVDDNEDVSMIDV